MDFNSGLTIHHTFNIYSNDLLFIRLEVLLLIKTYIIAIDLIRRLYFVKYFNLLVFQNKKGRRVRPGRTCQHPYEDSKANFSIYVPY